MGAMARLVVLWMRPYHPSAEEAQDWVSREAIRLLALDAVERAKLTRLENASVRHARDWDWMLEPHLARGADHAACAEAAPYAECVAELRQLGLRPTVLLADDGLDLLPGHG